MQQSRYLTVAERSNGDWLIHSGLSAAVLHVTRDKIAEFKALCEGTVPTATDPLLALAYNRVIDSFHRANILIDDDVDELRLIESRFFKARFSNTQPLMFTIAPTMRCNLACSYCYAAEATACPSSMSQSTIQQVGNFIGNLLAARPEHLRRINVSWAGGEPLADIPTFTSLAEEIFNKTESLGALYWGNGLVTNGTLLEEKLLNQLIVQPFKIRLIQLTLDGPRALHDSRRIALTKKPTFDLICGKMALAKQYVDIHVRVHVDANFEPSRFQQVIDDVLQTGAVETCDTNVTFHLGRLHCTSLSLNCQTTGSGIPVMSVDRYSALELECARVAKAAGVRFGMQDWAEPLDVPCGSVQEANYVIDAEGNLGKCWESMGMDKDTVGTVNCGPSFHCSAYHKWLDFNPFVRATCRECNYLPLCVGGCPLQADRAPQGSCESCKPGKFTLKERLLFQHFGE